jgi:putative Mg2+ transporter-C (MgtC) family protein
VFIIVTLEMYKALATAGSVARGDPMRVIETVTAGVAFPAAGASFRSGAEAHGLTTGAGMRGAEAMGVRAMQDTIR